MPNQIILFIDANFQGDHKHVIDQEPNLNVVSTDAQGHTTPVDSEFFRSVSSFVILAGNWQFFSQLNFGGDPFPVVLGPGLYRSVTQFKIANDSIASLRSVTAPPTVAGEPLVAHTVLFEHAAFHGGHRHVFEQAENLDDNGFNDATSSLVIELGNWTFFRDSEFDGHYPPIAGPGLYPWVEAIGITNDALSSLRPTTQAPTVSNAFDNHLLLFEDNAFRRGHKHVFAAEPNLNADDDDAFNDAVSSLAVLNGTWSFFADAGFTAPYAPSLGPGAYPSVTDQGISNDDMSSLRPTVPTPVKTGDAIVGEVILFEGINCHGRHRHIFNAEDNLNAAEDDSLNDAVSSIIVVSGNWQFFRNANWDDDYPSILGPGIYPRVADFAIRNDDLSSLKAVDLAPNVRGLPLTAHMLLFEHANFRGAHRHLIESFPYLSATDDFDTNVSSLVVERGNWQFFKESGFSGGEGPVLGPGLYPWVVDAGLPNDGPESAQPTDAAPTITAPPLTAHAMLFENSKLRGAHKHVFAAEGNLNASEDNDFNDAVSSVAVLLEQWLTYRDANFQGQYDVILGGGLFPSVSDVGIKNDDMSSLRVAGTVTGKGSTGAPTKQSTKPPTKRRTGSGQ
ncbi:MAG TPA: beta/gamma crystallin-related protein [Polyangia bacterium]|nr:beta/gamma crystallin-related protein [Polyangia bacterium]